MYIAIVNDETTAILIFFSKKKNEIKEAKA